MMYRKADGTKVWLKTTTRLPYLVLDGHLRTTTSYNDIRHRLSTIFQILPSISVADVFLVDSSNPNASILFCVSDNIRCAIIFIGEINFRNYNGAPLSLLEFNFFHKIDSIISTISKYCSAQFIIDRLNIETSIGEE